MKKKSLGGTLLIIFIICIPIVYAAVIYPSLPQTIPTHFDLTGKPNAYGEKSSLWLGVAVLAAVSLGTYLLISNLPKIDPKKTAGQSPEPYKKIAMVVVVFISAFNIIMVYSSKTGSIYTGKLLLPLMGLMFAILGNYMHSIKPNYFVGFRVPWTLEDPENWRKTHQLVGKIWVPGGLLISICTLLLPALAGNIVFGCIIAVMVIVPGVYSYLYFKKQQRLL